MPGDTDEIADERWPELYVEATRTALLTNALWLLVLGDATRTLSLDCYHRSGQWRDDTPILAIDDADPGLTPPPSAALAREEITLSGSGATGGWGSVSLPLPSDISLYGSSWFGRWYVADPAAADGYAVSPLLRWNLFPGRRAPGTALFADGVEGGTTAAWTATVP